VLSVEQLSIDIPEVQSSSHDGILQAKVDYVRESTILPFVVDDTSFHTERFPEFPGAYTKFINNSLGVEGWKRIFDDGDKIKAVARIALYYFGETRYFNGEIEGYLLFDSTQDADNFSLNDHIIVGDGQILRDALLDPAFLNHRRKALLALTVTLANTNLESETKKHEIGKRWTSRASEWKRIIEDEDSYVNYESNYNRVNALILQYAPLASGSALEVGCGTGEAGRILKAANPLLELLSTDIADGMLEQAKEQTVLSGLDITYKKLDITSDELGEEKFGIVISRGVVVSHLPKSNVYDFLKSAASHTANNGFLLFDFIQDTNVGDVEKPIDAKNQFTIKQMDEIMKSCNMKRVDDSGDDDMRVRVVCYRHSTASGNSR
jgi:XTP/dITP diphosphohydrolase